MQIIKYKKFDNYCNYKKKNRIIFLELFLSKRKKEEIKSIKIFLFVVVRKQIYINKVAYK